MSSFRVLYNLEVLCHYKFKSLTFLNPAPLWVHYVVLEFQILSSKLMPIQRDTATLQSARTFCEDFLTAGGLSQVVNVLQKEAMPMEVDYETRQGIYSIALQLLQYVCHHAFVYYFHQLIHLTEVNFSLLGSLDSL